MHVPPKRILSQNDRPKPLRKLIHHHKTQDFEPHSRAVFLISGWGAPQYSSALSPALLSNYLGVRQELPWSRISFLQHPDYRLYYPQSTGMCFSEARPAEWDLPILMGRSVLNIFTEGAPRLELGFPTVFYLCLT